MAKTKKSKTPADRKQYQREYYERTKRNQKKKERARQNYLANRESKVERARQNYLANRESRLVCINAYNEATREQKRKRIESTRVSFTNFESHHCIEMDPGDGVDRHFEGHQNCPEANTILNHITTYRNHFTGNPENPKEYDKLKEQIRAQYIAPAKQKELAEKFLLSQGRGCEWAGEGGMKMFVDGKSRDAPILGCACCGFRCKDSKNEYVKEPLSELSMLKLNDEEKEEHVERIKKMNFYLPSDNAGTLKLFKLWKVWSIWPQVSPSECSCSSDGDNDIDYYFLHPEFVELVETDNIDDNFRRVHNTHCAWLCPSCHKDLKKKENIPSMSIKAGVDYGSYHRVGLEPLTLIERHIISRVRLYSQVLKIESNSGRQREHTQCCIKGCCIAFDHDSPRVCVDVLSKDAMIKDLCIHFVGPQGQHDTLLQNTRHIKPTHLFGRAFVVYQWIKTLSVINPRYKYDGELPSFLEVKRTMEEAVDCLIDESIKTFDDEAVKRTEIARDDIAGIRATSNRDELQLSDISAQCPTASSSTKEISASHMPLRYSYVTNVEKTANNSHTDTTHEFLVNAAKTAGINVELEQNEYNKSKSMRSENPLSEFDNGESILAGGWPDVFMLGNASLGEKSSPSDAQVGHLLMQFTQNAATNRLLLFYLFDRKQRMSTIRSMHAKIKQNPESFEKFTQTFMHKDFQTKLQNAVANPEGKDAKHILNKLVPMLACGGKQTVFGALERRRAAGEILSMGRKYGPASNFLTINIDDVNTPSVFRMAFRNCNNINFPSHCPDSLLKAMELGSDYRVKGSDCIHGSDCIGHGEVNIPCNWSSLATSATENPVSVAVHYKKVIHDLMSILVGIRPGTTSGENNRTVKTEYRGWGEKSLGVIVGTGVAFIGVTETTARGGLHFHVGKYCSSYSYFLSQGEHHTYPSL